MRFQDWESKRLVEIPVATRDCCCQTSVSTVAKPPEISRHSAMATKSRPSVGPKNRRERSGLGWGTHVPLGMAASTGGPTERSAARQAPSLPSPVTSHGTVTAVAMEAPTRAARGWRSRCVYPSWCDSYLVGNLNGKLGSRRPQ